MYPSRTRLASWLAAGCMTALAYPASAASYRDNLTSCIMGRSACDRAALRDDDAEYLRTDRTSRTRDPAMAGKIAEARLQRPIRIVVSERRLDHMHARTIAFERYRSIVRAEQHGWVPGVNRPYEQPVEAWAIPPRHRQRERVPAGILGYGEGAPIPPEAAYGAPDGYRGVGFLE